jgi:hypothetical protein
MLEQGSLSWEAWDRDINRVVLLDIRLNDEPKSTRETGLLWTRSGLSLQLPKRHRLLPFNSDKARARAFGPSNFQSLLGLSHSQWKVLFAVDTEPRRFGLNHGGPHLSEFLLAPSFVHDGGPRIPDAWAEPRIAINASGASRLDKNQVTFTRLQAESAGILCFSSILRLTEIPGTSHSLHNGRKP